MSLTLTKRLLLYVHFGLFAGVLSYELIAGHSKWFGHAPWQTIAAFTGLVYFGAAMLTLAAWVAMSQFRRNFAICAGAIVGYLLILYIVIERSSLPNE